MSYENHYHQQISAVNFLLHWCNPHATSHCPLRSPASIAPWSWNPYWVLYVNNWLMFHFYLLSFDVRIHDGGWWLNKQVTTTCDLFYRLNSLKFRNQDAIEMITVITLVCCESARKCQWCIEARSLDQPSNNYIWAFKGGESNWREQVGTLQFLGEPSGTIENDRKPCKKIKDRPDILNHITIFTTACFTPGHRVHTTSSLLTNDHSAAVGFRCTMQRFW